MIFLYDENAKNELLRVQNEEFMHLKARRIRQGERIDVRNLKDGYNYIYEVVNLGKKDATLELIMRHSISENLANLTVAWAVVDPCVIEKTLPSLNEIGIKKLILVYSQFSQKNIKLDMARFRRILISSSQQCGRNSLLEVEILNNSDELKSLYENVVLIDFVGESLDKFEPNMIPYIGAEGGFSQNEREMFDKKFTLKTTKILRSNTAIIGVCAKILF